MEDFDATAVEDFNIALKNILDSTYPLHPIENDHAAEMPEGEAVVSENETLVAEGTQRQPCQVEEGESADMKLGPSYCFPYKCVDNKIPHSMA